MRLGGVPGMLSAERKAEREREGQQWSSPAALLEHTAEHWAEFVDGGRVVVASVDERSARINLWADAVFQYYFQNWIPGWLKRGLERTGVRSVTVAYEPPESEASYLHRYHVTWE